MKMQAARSILAFGLAIGTAGAALAGPTGSPGPTPTATVTVPVSPTPTPTATVTVPVSPTPTPTATVTAIPTATATPTPTVTASPTPSSTPPPGDLSGERFFLDKKNAEKNETLMDVDTQTSAFCLAGRAVGVDPTTTFNRLVVFTYSSLGTISKANTKSVKGDFVDVQLRLTIDELDPEADPNAPLDFDQTITTGCKLKGSLKKEGEEARATLQCDVGENLSAFTDLEQAEIENVANAFTARKNLVVKVRKGKIKFTHRGEPAPGDLAVPADLLEACGLGGNGNGG
jgi:hypothetical protein